MSDTDDILKKLRAKKKWDEAAYNPYMGEVDYADDAWQPIPKKEPEKVSYDELDRIAEKALEELERNGIIDILILKDDKVRTWWAERKKKLDEERRERERVEYERQVRETALGKLTSEERRVLGLPTVVKRVRRPTA